MAWDNSTAGLAEGAVSDGVQGYLQGGRYFIPNKGNIWSNGEWRQPSEIQQRELQSQQMNLQMQQTQAEGQLTQTRLDAAREELAAKRSYQGVADKAGNQLSQLLTNPSSIESLPGYQFSYNQGLEAVNRTNAAKGMLGSGNRLYDLTKYGQGMASTQYNNTLSNLGNFLNKNTMSSTGSLASGYSPTTTPNATTRSVGNSVAVNPYMGGYY